MKKMITFVFLSLGLLISLPSFAACAADPGMTFCAYFTKGEVQSRYFKVIADGIESPPICMHIGNNGFGYYPKDVKEAVEKKYIQYNKPFRVGVIQCSDANCSKSLAPVYKTVVFKSATEATPQQVDFEITSFGQSCDSLKFLDYSAPSIYPINPVVDTTRQNI